jgi:lipoprotein-anchoring transpeptidase ErfK/SrfK
VADNVKETVMRAGLVALSLAVAVGLGVGYGAAAVHAERSRTQPSASPQASQPSAPTTSDVRPTASATPSAVQTTAEPVVRILWKLDDSGAAVRALEARLAQLDRMPTKWVDGSYGTETVKGVRAYQHDGGLPVTGSVDEDTWASLMADTRTPTRAELYPPRPTAKPGQPAALDERCLTGRVLCVDKTTRELSWVVDGVVQRRLDVRFGSEFTPTREGVFSVYRMSANHVSSVYGSSMPYAMFFSRGQAVHYSSDFATRGYAGASHGCVNVRDKASLAALFAQVRVGDTVVVHRS